MRKAMPREKAVLYLASRLARAEGDARGAVRHRRGASIVVRQAADAATAATADGDGSADNKESTKLHFLQNFHANLAISSRCVSNLIT